MLITDIEKRINDSLNGQPFNIESVEELVKIFNNACKEVGKRVNFSSYICAPYRYYTDGSDVIFSHGVLFWVKFKIKVRRKVYPDDFTYRITKVEAIPYPRIPNDLEELINFSRKYRQKRLRRLK